MKQRASCGTEDGSNQLVTGHSPHVTPAVSARDEDLREGEFYAVRDVSFELRRGECLGIIGHNGAGKTTLLKMLNGLIKPDTGCIEINGRVGALIALGAGFNPILTGRENVYINGAVLGLRKAEVDQKIDEIIEFAEIREFIDMPVQSYSSGMAVRLGFSVASALRPDVLILDEVLAVGDIGFVVKCLNRLRDVAADAAVILVSHNKQSISGFCSRVILMEKGRGVMDTTDVGSAIDLYQESSGMPVSEAGTGDVKVLRCELTDTQGLRQQSTGGHYDPAAKKLLVEFEVSQRIHGSECQLNLADAGGMAVIAMPIMGPGSAKRRFSPGRHKITIPIDTLDLNAGSYHCTLVFRDPDNRKIHNRSQGMASFRVVAEICQGARVVRPVWLEN